MSHNFKGKGAVTYERLHKVLLNNTQGLAKYDLRTVADLELALNYEIAKLLAEGVVPDFPMDKIIVDVSNWSLIQWLPRILVNWMKNTKE